MVNYLGVAKTDINGTGFRTARNTLAAESAPLALNVVIKNRMKVKELISKICSFADMILVKKRKAATSSYLWDVNVLRSTDTGTAAVYPSGNQFNDSNTNNVLLHEATFATIYTDIVLEVEHPDTGVKQGLKFVNENARQIVGGVREKKIDYGFKIKNDNTGSPILTALASREASKLTRPLMQISFDYPFSSSNLLYPGDVIYYKNEQYGISSYKAFRIKEVSGRSENNIKMTIKAIELWQEGDFINVPEAWRVPTQPTAGTAGDYQVISAYPEIAFPKPGITGFFEQTSSFGAYSMSLWAQTKDGSPNFMNMPLIAQGTLAVDYSGTNFVDNYNADNDTGCLQFTLSAPYDEPNWWNTIDIDDDDFYLIGGHLALIYESSAKYEIVAIQKIVENAPDYYAYKLIRNVFGPYSYGNTFGTESNTYSSGSKIFIYPTPYGFSNLRKHIKGGLIDGDDFSGGTAGDKYFNGAMRYRYKAGITTTPTTTLPRPRMLDFAGTTLNHNPFISMTPYPVDDLQLFAATETQAHHTDYTIIFLRCNPTRPRSPRGNTLINTCKTSGWGFSGVYEREDLTNFKITIGNIEFFVDPISMKWLNHISIPPTVGASSTVTMNQQAGKLSSSLGSVSGSNGVDGVFLAPVTSDEYYNGYLDLAITFDNDVAGSPSSVSIQCYVDDVLSEAASITI